MKSLLKKVNSTNGGSKSVRWAETLEKAVWFSEDAPPSETVESVKPSGSSLKFSALSKSKRVEKLGGGENLFNLPVQSKKVDFGLGVPSPNSTYPQSTFIAAAPLVSNPTIVVNSDWKEAVDAASQEIYYYHTKTNETTWEIPEEYRKFKEYLAQKEEKEMIEAARKAKFAKLRKSEGEGLMLKRKQIVDKDDGDEAEDDDVVEIPSYLKQPDEKKAHQTMLLAARKFHESSQFEFILKLKQANNPDFAFLIEGNDFNPYYEWLKEGNNEARVSNQIKKEEEEKKKREVQQGPVGLLGASYSSDEDSDDDDNTDVSGGVLVPPGEVKETIKTMVAFVLKNGLPFEETVREREKHRDTNKFSFLQKNSPYYPFYVRERDVAIGGSKTADDLENSAAIEEAEISMFHQAYINLYEAKEPDSLTAASVPTRKEALWQQYVKAKAAEAAALVTARGGVVGNSGATSSAQPVPNSNITIASTTTLTAEDELSLFQSKVESTIESIKASRENSAASAAVEAIKKRSRLSADVDVGKKSVKDVSLTQEEKDELRKKRLKRAKMMSGHLKLKMMETKDAVEKQKEKDKLENKEKKLDHSGGGGSGSSGSDADESFRNERSGSRDRDRDRRRDRKYRDRDRDRDRGRDRDRHRGRRRDRDRDNDRHRAKRSRRSRSRSRSRS